MKQKERVLIVSMLGSALEVYDFALYGSLVGLLAKVFFPSNDPFVSILSSLAAFSACMVTRPVGALVFGYIGDRFGRKRALIFSMFLSSFSMFAIGIMPSYETIGVLAPCFIFLARMIQGISFGGAYNGSAIFALEHLAKSKSRTFPGLIGGIISSSASIGVVFATMAGIGIFYFQEIHWLWRIPFLFGASIGFLGFYIRSRTLETPEFQENMNHPQSSFLQIVKNYPKSCLVTFAFGAITGFITYTSVGFLTFYMSYYLHIPLSQAIFFNLCASMAWVISSPIFGYISDFVDRRAYFIVAILGNLMIIPFIFSLFQTHSTGSMIVGQILLGLTCSSIVGPQHAFTQKLFPVDVRYMGISVSYCLGGAIFGGIAPMTLVFLIEKTGSLNMPVIFFAIYAIFLMVAVINLGSPNNKFKKFDEFRHVS
jgi:MHS family proline/betaine transporter-like MFS transporter